MSGDIYLFEKERVKIPENRENRSGKRASFRKLTGLAAAGLASAIGLLALFAYFASELAENELEYLDRTVGEWIRRPSAAWLRRLAVFITWLGSGYVEALVLAAVGGYLVVRRKQVREAIVLAAGLLGAWLLNVALKSVFARSRPDIRHLVQAGGYSFPSGHAMVSAFFYGMLGYLIWRRCRKKRLPAWPVPLLTAVLVLAIGVSRIYLGVHFASDVIAGFAAGTVWLIACIGVLETWRRRQSAV